MPLRLRSTNLNFITVPTRVTVCRSASAGDSYHRPPTISSISFIIHSHRRGNHSSSCDSISLERSLQLSLCGSDNVSWPGTPELSRRLSDSTNTVTTSATVVTGPLFRLSRHMCCAYSWDVHDGQYGFACGLIPSNHHYVVHEARSFFSVIWRRSGRIAIFVISFSSFLDIWHRTPFVFGLNVLISTGSQRNENDTVSLLNI